MSYEPLHHKYRPQTFADLVGQEAIATTLTNAILMVKIAPAYLFTGPRGTGKTSSARILAKSLNCLKENKPTAQPCGVCNVCQGIAKGSALDVIEIDAASNTGVDNIREIIERAQFAPVQCRYKVYAIDECLTGDSLVQTTDGLIRIDNPNINGKKALSYNESSGAWEFKKVVRWLDQGERQTLVIKTTNREIRCTGNHLIRTETGWMPAKFVKAGVKILSPVNVDAETSSINMEQMDVSEDLPEDISSKAIHTGKSYTTLPLSWNRLKLFDPSVLVDEVAQTRHTTISGWAQTLQESCWQTLNSIPYPQWITNLEVVESVKVGGIARVYDIEVEGNHNFVANGLLAHNCHMLSTAAFNALLKTLEEPPARVVFVLATTDPQRVLPTIISRCQRFDFRRIPLAAMVQHLGKIATQENINITPQAIQLVAQVAQGGLRDAESLLDQLSLLSGQVTVERVWDLVGSVAEPDLIELLGAIAQNQPEAVLDCARRIMDRGREPLTLLQNLAGFYRDLLIAKTAPSRSDLIAVTPATWKALCDLAKVWDISQILAGQQHLATSEVQIKQTTQPRLWLEVALIGLLSATPRSQSGSVPEIHIQRQPINVSFQNTATQPQVNNGSSQTPPPTPAASPAETSHNGELNPATELVESHPLDRAAAPSPAEQETPPPAEPEASTSPPVPESAATVEPTSPATQPPSDANPAGETSMAEIWQQVLTQLEPMSTRELLRQMGRLVEFDSTKARIGMRSQILCERAKAYLPNIKAAFRATFNCEIQVTLELAKPTQAKATSIEQSPTPPKVDAAPITSPPIVAKIAQSPAILSPQVPTLTEAQPPNDTEVAAAKLDVVTETATTIVEEDDSKAAIASAQSLAKFFKGEVVTLKDDLVLSQPVTQDNSSSPDRSNWDRAEPEEEEDIDDF